MCAILNVSPKRAMLSTYKSVASFLLLNMTLIYRPYMKVERSTRYPEGYQQIRKSKYRISVDERDSTQTKQAYIRKSFENGKYSKFRIKSKKYHY